VADEGRRVNDFGDLDTHLTVSEDELREFARAAERLRRHFGDEKPARVAYEAVLAAAGDLPEEPEGGRG
jgi:hypothetical protein